MKLRSLLFICCFGLFSTTFATTQHIQPKLNLSQAKSPAKRGMAQGYCQIEVNNTSYSPATVSGDGLAPFNIYPGEIYDLDMLYQGYCYAGMYLQIDGVDSWGRIYNIYGRYTYTGSTVYIYPTNNMQIKASVKAS